LIFAVPEIEPRALHLLDKQTTTWTIPPVLYVTRNLTIWTNWANSLSDAKILNPCKNKQELWLD
jgi:hypothetical protein